jgi:pilus assembly protein Flp/PilA
LSPAFLPLSFSSSSSPDVPEPGGGTIALLRFGRAPDGERISTQDKTMLHSVKKFLISEDGPTAVEYAVMLALIVVVCLTAVRAIGTNANQKFEDVKNSLT